MGGKGQRRRVKNYKAAHGGYTRLPPPPNPRELEALPSKLRFIMELKNGASAPPGSSQSGKEGQREKKKRSTSGERKANPHDLHPFPDSEFALGDKNDEARSVEDKDAVTSTESRDRRKGKKKRKAVNDLRFQDLDPAAAHTRKQKRKKEFFEAKKNKHKKVKQDAVRDFPGHEEIKFGEVVEAPPKLSFLKGLKTAQDASHERRRLEVVEAYRNRKGWLSRPGIHLPPIAETPST